jgi:hypothetical protein
VPVAMLLSPCAAKIEEKGIKMKIENLLVAKKTNIIGSKRMLPI